jgi:hypothetical protein
MSLLILPAYAIALYAIAQGLPWLHDRVIRP